MDCITVYTDGACKGNPGPGGWAAILIHDNTRFKKILHGGESKTTNNRMELTAVIKALDELKWRCNVQVFTDSKYVSDTINNKWRIRKNFDLWNELESLLARHNVTFTWVKGHADNLYNNICDRLATHEAEERSNYAVRNN